MASVLRLGGLASMCVGAAYLLSAAAFLAQPPVLRGAGSPHEFWLALAEGSTPHLALHWFSALSGILGLAVVPAVLRLVRDEAEGLALWASALAYVGFAVTARSHLMEVEFDLRVAPLYATLAPETQATVPLIAGLALDVPHGWLTMGGIGFWVFAVSWLGLRAESLSRGLVYLGFALATAFLAAVVGFSFLLLPLVTLGVGLGGLVLAPVWFVWLGFALRDRARA
ncbi:MAG: hypothetical protein QNK05_14825 [Myxococcota bacterium]|nr:hypothetical protein [Myxococcota bacterium]